MAQSSLEAALDRLTRGVARLEHAANATAPSRAGGLGEAYAALDERHGLLRLRIQETIDRLDRLIEDEGGPA